MLGESDLRPATRLGDLYPVLLPRLQQAAVRDLLWLLASPGLLRTGAAGVPQALAEADPRLILGIVDWLAQNDAAPTALLAGLAASGHKRLGHYAEQLLAYFLASGMLGTLLAANLPLRRARLTLGECDFLLETHAGARLHWELAVKCYLYVDDPQSVAGELAGVAAGSLADDDFRTLACDVGPNLADRFDVKLTRMVRHQLRLSTRPEFAALVAGGPWQAELFLRGWLFYPLAPARSSACRSPALLDAQHLRGWWASVDDWQRWGPTLGAERWLVLPRLAWMAPHRLAADSPQAALLLDQAEMLAKLERHFGVERALSEHPMDMLPGAVTGPELKPPGPWLIAGLVADASGWREVTRGFVVDAGWFGRARVYAASQQPEPGTGALQV